MTHPHTVLASGVMGLDVVLGGGLSSSDLVFVVGAPGAGKTVLASEIIFMAARRGVQTLIITTHSEGPIKLLSHLRGFTFFDETLVGTTVSILTLSAILSDRAADMATKIARTIRESKATLVLIDGLQGFTSELAEQGQFHRILASLSTQLSYLQTTILVTLAENVRDRTIYSALTTADITIGLTYTVDEMEHVRLLEVVKRRGGSQLPGQHPYSITPTGIQIFPRLESYPLPTNDPDIDGRATFGLAELDRILGGGLVTSTITILAGAAGTGKTILALHWALAAASADSKTLYVSFRERVPQLRAKAAAFALDLPTALDSGVIDVLYVDPVALRPDQVAQFLLERCRETTTSRVVIDEIGPLLLVLGRRAPMYLSALASHLYSAGITALWLYEIMPFTGFRLNLTETALGSVGDNLILIQQQEVQNRLRRILAVLRMRVSAYDRTIRELDLDPQGIRVLTPEESDTGMLSAAATASGSAAPPDPDAAPTDDN